MEAQVLRQRMTRDQHSTRREFDPTLDPTPPRHRTGQTLEFPNPRSYVRTCADFRTWPVQAPAFLISQYRFASSEAKSLKDSTIVSCPRSSPPSTAPIGSTESGTGPRAVRVKTTTSVSLDGPDDNWPYCHRTWRRPFCVGIKKCHSPSKLSKPTRDDTCWGGMSRQNPQSSGLFQTVPLGIWLTYVTSH